MMHANQYGPNENYAQCGNIHDLRPMREIGDQGVECKLFYDSQPQLGGICSSVPRLMTCDNDGDCAKPDSSYSCLDQYAANGDKGFLRPMTKKDDIPMHCNMDDSTQKPYCASSNYLVSCDSNSDCRKECGHDFAPDKLYAAGGDIADLKPMRGAGDDLFCMHTPYAHAGFCASAPEQQQQKMFPIQRIPFAPTSPHQGGVE